MHQSIRAVNIPSPGDSHILFALPPGFFPKKFWFSSGQIFPEIDKNLKRISILVNVFKRLLKTGRKTLVVFHNNCILSPTKPFSYIDKK